jgi:hypothetical protein
MKRITALVIALLILLVGFRLTHHPVYGHCHKQGADTICTLIKWEGNK